MPTLILLLLITGVIVVGRTRYKTWTVSRRILFNAFSALVLSAAMAISARNLLGQGALSPEVAKHLSYTTLAENMETIQLAIATAKKPNPRILVIQSDACLGLDPAWFEEQVVRRFKGKADFKFTTITVKLFPNGMECNSDGEAIFPANFESGIYLHHATIEKIRQEAQSFDAVCSFLPPIPILSSGMDAFSPQRNDNFEALPCPLIVRDSAASKVGHELLKDNLINILIQAKKFADDEILKELPSEEVSKAHFSKCFEIFESKGE
ncbi:MAG: hypothetical protein RL095_2448 [Verrucomicrobiota bacterium]|jgi:hypothetical protein